MVKSFKDLNFGAHDTIVDSLNDLNTTLGTKASQSDLGTLSNLTTTDKTSLVNAINEHTTQLAQIVLYNALNVKAPFGTSLTPAKGDGITDDQAAIQAAVDYLSSKGGGTLFLPQGNYKLLGTIVWHSNVSIIGAGIGKSILKTVGTGFAAITNTTDGTNDNPLANCAFMDFEIDGSGINDTTYNLGSKGIFILRMRRAIFKNLYIHDTGGSGLGCDFLDDSIIDSVIVENCGRLWSSGYVGGAGIGIGTGTWATKEGLVISNCHAINCGNYGIFCENQWLGTYSKFIKIVNCTVTGGRNTGISNKGNNNMIVSNCTISNNAQNGFSVEDESHECILENCIITDNGNNGVDINQRVQNYKIHNCIIARNAKRGIFVHNGWNNMLDITITNNELYGNLIGLTFGTNTDAALALTNVTVNNNKIFNNNAIAIEFGCVFINLTVNHNDVFNNGLNYGALYNGNYAFVFSANATFVQIVGNHIFDNQATKTQRKGIYQASGLTWDTVRIENNDVFGNISNGIELNGTNTNLVRKRNNGDPLIVENSGAATIPSGSTSVSTPHGLSITPDIKNVIVIPTNNMGNATKYWVSAVGAANIVINVNADPGTGGATFVWRIVS
jgi:hypothetical protein